MKNDKIVEEYTYGNLINNKNKAKNISFYISIYKAD